MLGFGGIAGASIEIAKIIFVIALVLFLVSAVFGIVRGRRISYFPAQNSSLSNGSD